MREAPHCTMQIERPAPNIVVVTIDGIDVGELGDWPFETLTEDLQTERAIDLFIDARNTRGASMGVSSAWAVWLLRHRDALRSVNMVTGSRLVQMTAELVRRFAGLEGRMRITNDASAFDWALDFAVRP